MVSANFLVYTDHIVRKLLGEQPEYLPNQEYNIPTAPTQTWGRCRKKKDDYEDQ